jgi:hypothetical protein
MKGAVGYNPMRMGSLICAVHYDPRLSAVTVSESDNISSTKRNVSAGRTGAWRGDTFS